LDPSKIGHKKLILIKPGLPRDSSKPLNPLGTRAMYLGSQATTVESSCVFLASRLFKMAGKKKKNYK
jgi:hypothetical protein